MEKNKPKLKSIPYANTTILPEDSIADIKKLLKSHGITDIQETTISGASEIRFIYRSQERSVSFLIRPPMIMAVKKTWNQKIGRYENVKVPMVAQSWRLVYWFLEKKLEAVRYGLVSLEREFLNNMLTSGDKTVGDYIIQRLDADKGILKLEGPTESVQDPGSPKVIEASYVVSDNKEAS